MKLAIQYRVNKLFRTLKKRGDKEERLAAQRRARRLVYIGVSREAVIEKLNSAEGRNRIFKSQYSVTGKWL